MNAPESGEGVSVCISDIGDPRLPRLLQSLKVQTRPRLLRSLKVQTQPPMEILVESRGTVAESRNLMVERSTGEILVFIDADEEAPAHWLHWLTRPIRIGSADIVCGQTMPHPSPWYPSRYLGYLAGVDARHYDLCREDQTIYPMGNTAWRREIFDCFRFDERFGGWAGEDYDINLLAWKKGFVGRFEPRAWVWHDQSHLNTAWRIVHRKYRYMVGAAMAFLKHGRIQDAISRVRERPKRLHWLELLDPPLRALAYLKARSLV